ncbi:MAG: hypothetical protein ACRDD2_03375 [Sarcina sp.]
MINNYKINLQIENQNLFVKLNLTLNNSNLNSNLKLMLNKGLIIRNVTDQYENKINFIEDFSINHPFIPDCKRIIIDIPAGTTDLNFSYKGKISGWYNLISENIIALNLYSAWYPLLEDYPISNKKNVTIENLPDFIVVNGIKDNKNWYYQCSDFDCNILAAKDWNISTFENISPKLKIYSRNNNLENLNDLSNSFESIITYFSKLLEIPKNTENNNETFNIVIPDIDQGGYCRENLILLSNLSKDKIAIDSFLAHECGHIWSKGANTNSWEDWLNETFAEILSLFYIKTKHGMIPYINIINSIKERAENAPNIKTKNGERPDGVHFKGTYLMLQVIKKFGEDIVIEITKLFINLEIKTTENLLNSIEKTIGQDVAKFIEENL